MNSFQELWWKQAKSDHDLLIRLRELGASPCHQLHYLQMTTEKLGKGYFWRSGVPPLKSHASFVQCLRAFSQVRGSERSRLANAFQFRRHADLRSWIRSALPLAYRLERLAPALAGDGPNPEYPWPPDIPTKAPVDFEFDVWNELVETGNGRRLLRIVELAIDRFPQYA
jgi:hypothetical protein